MIQPILIGLIIVVAIRAELPGLPLIKGVPPGAVALTALGSLAVIAVVTHVLLAALGRGLDRTGSHRLLTLADATLDISRVAVLVAHGFAVIGVGWLDVVRAWLGGGDPARGDWILIDEALVLLPPTLALLAGWWSYFVIDRRLREAALLSSLEFGEAVLRLPTRAQYLADHVRHHLLLIILPVGFLTAWTEFIAWAVDYDLVGLRTRLGVEPQSWGVLGLHALGVAGLLATMPLILRRLWRTVALGPGELRDRLLELCARQGVRCRDVLVWRTHHSMVNGAMVGIVPRLRYIMLTETLLERLPIDQVEAVMAHEVAHARRHHLPWLLAVLVSSIGLCWMAFSAVIAWGVELTGVPVDGLIGALLGVGMLVAALAAALLVFGAVSRVFERQADAFGAQHLSGMTRDLKATGGLPVRPDAAEAMINALGAVARINRISPARFSWRHGSILTRQRALRATIGRPVGSLHADRVAGRIKLAALAGIAALMILTIVGA